MLENLWTQNDKVSMKQLLEDDESSSNMLAALGALLRLNASRQVAIEHSGAVITFTKF